MVGLVIDENMRKFTVSLYKKGCHVSHSITATAAVVLLGRTDDEPIPCGRSLLKRLEFRRRAATTDKVEKPESAKKGVVLQHHYCITSIVEKHNIPESLVINSDQTPLKYVQVGHFTMA